MLHESVKISIIQLWFALLRPWNKRLLLLSILSSCRTSQKQCFTNISRPFLPLCDKYLNSFNLWTKLKQISSHIYTLNSILLLDIQAFCWSVIDPFREFKKQHKKCLAVSKQSPKSICQTVFTPGKQMISAGYSQRYNRLLVSSQQCIEVGWD